MSEMDPRARARPDDANNAKSVCGLYYCSMGWTEAR
jgi:hypothetical protein